MRLPGMRSRGSRSRRLVRRRVAALGGVALLAAGAVVVAAGPAGATSVSTEMGLRNAFGNASETAIDLTADITLSTCPDGLVSRNSPVGLILDGHGHTITQTCTTGNSSVFDQLGTGLVAFQNVTITGGHTTGLGAGINSNGAVSLTNATVTNNTTASFGGGIVAQGAVTLTNSTVSGNTASIAGGGIAAVGAVTLTNSTVSGNTGTSGVGGIFALGAAVTLTNSTVSGNTATFGAVGGIGAGGAVTLTNSTVSGNTAAANAGGIIGLVAVTLINSTVANNTATQGGGVQTAGGVMTFVYATVVGNTASAGASVEGNGTSQLMSFASVVAKPAGGGTNCTALAGTSSNGFNFSDDTSCGFTAGTDKQNAGDPGLGPLANNGGPTQTLLPHDGPSPLIDGVAAGSCQNGGASGITTDQRGLPRPDTTSPACDIGAVEVQVPPTPPTPTAVVITPRFTG